ncbi:SURF1 family protein [Prosthecodimorpha staleyi]|uniref:SURF1-like protein n=1 Tax=Prosthecodimorpha staleyi TaxID=2840188 RepID=A0A947D2C5_9HYPH|nr:SURF1 family protein [Prosthecodimorpha staleyi]MBT9289426.1 SURF1 family protein [Prosthecodimorpha staleyi]
MSRLRLVLWPTVAAAFVFAILIALGNWQMDRLAWKEALMARVKARIALPAENLPPEPVWPAIDADAKDYAAARVTGRFLNDKEVHVFHTLVNPKGRLSGQGYFVVTPLLRDDGSVIIVNRGFVPLDRKAPASRPGSQIDGETTVEGLLRRPEGSNLFTPANDRAGNVWFTRDAREIAHAAGLDPARTFPLTLDAGAAQTPPGGLPQAGETLVTFTNNHWQYALTWYGLAATLAGVWFAFVIGRLRRNPAGA